MNSKCKPIVSSDCYLTLVTLVSANMVASLRARHIFVFPELQGLTRLLSLQTRARPVYLLGIKWPPSAPSWQTVTHNSGMFSLDYSDFGILKINKPDVTATAVVVERIEFDFKWCWLLQKCLLLISRQVVRQKHVKHAQFIWMKLTYQFIQQVKYYQKIAYYERWKEN